MEAFSEQPAKQEKAMSAEQVNDPFVFKTIIQGFLLKKIMGSAGDDGENNKEKRKKLLDTCLHFGEWFEEKVVQGAQFDKEFLNIFKKDKQSVIGSIREKFHDGWKEEDIEEGTPVREFINMVGSVYMPELFPESATKTTSVRESERMMPERKEQGVSFFKKAA